MNLTLRDVMSPAPTVQPATATLADAARAMRDHDIGDVLVERDGSLCGIVTDRDIVVRAVAEDRMPSEVQLGEICSNQLTTLGPDSTLDEAVTLMRTQAVRRLPVCENGRPLGIVSLGDLAMDRDPNSALAGISAAAPNN